MKKLMISVIMPAYNAEKYIEESINSVINQTYKIWELIIIDDGSTDKTHVISKQKACEEKRIKYFYQTNGRQAKARNFGVSNSSGDLIAFIDADDLWMPEKLEVMVTEFINGDQDLLFSGSYIFEKSFDFTNLKEGIRKMEITNQIYFGYNGLSEFLEINRIPILTVLVKTEIIRELQFNENVVPAEDYDLWLRMLLNGYKFRSISNPLSAYRLHPDASTAEDRLVIDKCIEIIKFLKDTNRDPSLTDLYNKKLERWYFLKLNSIYQKNHSIFNEGRRFSIPIFTIIKFWFNTLSIY